MTFAELKQWATAELKHSGCESADFETRCLLEDLAGFADSHLNKSVAPETVSRIQEAVNKRIQGFPLQYILGEWEFLNLRLKVGEGVLIPRPDTEILCETAANWINTNACSSARVLDLCAGSGCVGLGIASLCKAVDVTLVELSDKALPYLLENIRRYSRLCANAVVADVLQGYHQFEESRYDVLVSNPPYIPSSDIAGLMREVQHEPRMALDGGDGYVFYRTISEKWLKVLKPGGLCAVEIGIGQAETVKTLFTENGLTDICVYRDYGDIERVVTGIKAV